MIGIIAIKSGNLPQTRYGHLYNKKIVIDAGNLGQLVSGYHIPSQSDFETLISFLGGSTAASIALRQEGNTNWGYPNYATNSSGFNALGGGERDITGSYYGIRYQCCRFLWQDCLF